MDLDEKEALESLYCLPGECKIQDNEVAINLLVEIPDDSTGGRVHDIRSALVKVILAIGQDYPNTIPDISIFSEHLDRETVFNVKSRVISSCQDYVGNPFVISLISEIHECLKLTLKGLHIEKHQVVNGSCSTSYDSLNIDKDDIWTSLLHIDHMRSKTKYCKTLLSWAEELGLTGRLIFYKRLILVLLQGYRRNNKEFIVRLKTVSIDVDSKGHSCKERMMTVLCEEKKTAHKGFSKFEKREPSDETELYQIFVDADLKNIFAMHVLTLKHYM